MTKRGTEEKTREGRFRETWEYTVVSCKMTFLGYGLFDLTRFNKICHPSQRPRWQVDKEAIGLSRVQQCSTYSLPS